MHITLKTPRLTLRPIGPEDLKTTFAYAGCPENARYMVYLPHASPEETLVFLRAAAQEWQKDAPLLYEFAVMLGTQHIGGVSLTLDDAHAEAELAWILHRDYWHKGYASEAAMALRDFGLHELRLRRIFATCDARNAASARVMERIGMALETEHGVRCNRCEPGVPAQELAYALYAANEWPQ